jgi:Ran GTPase-activating protein (RanGAP) involved in mRNA processing and transport
VSALAGLLHQLHKQLEVLDLGGNGFHDTAMTEALAAPLRELTCLRSLYYSLQDTAAVIALCDALHCMPCLEELRLSFYRMDRAGAAKLAATLPRLSRLRVLDASIHLRSSKGATEFCTSTLPALPQRMQLTELALVYISVSARTLCEALQSGRLARLSTLAFKNCDFGTGTPSRVAAATQAGVATVLRALTADSVPNLKRLEVSSTNLGSAGAAALVDALPRLPKLESLVLPRCNLDEADGVAVFSALVSVRNLEFLVAYRNYIGPKGCAALAAVMKHLPRLQQLNVSFCDILDEGLQLLSRALRYVPRLTQLQLIGNGLTAVGMQTLVGLLRSGTVPLLTELSLADNVGIGDDGIAALASILPVCAPRLTVLRLYDTGTRLGGLCALVRSMVHLPALKIVTASLVEDLAYIGDDVLSYLLDQVVRLPGVAVGAAWDARIVDEIVPCLASRASGAGSGASSTEPSSGVSSLPSNYVASVASASDEPLPLPICSVLGAWAAEYGWTRRRALVAVWQAAHPYYID